MKWSQAVALTCTVLVWSLEIRAQDCDCDHTLEPGALTVVGSELGVTPGDRICVLAGNYEFIRFQGIQGADVARVEIVNCGGLVRIHNDDRGYALVFEADAAGNASQHFHLSGTGNAEVFYGFEISAPAIDPWPGFGLTLVGRSTNYEVDHVEIHDTGFAGVSAKTDPLCDGSADQENFVQRDVELHHMYVHETGGEAFYIGSTQSYGQTITCDEVEEVHQPHFLEGIHVHHNLIENTQWDGAQIGMARSDCAFYANTVRNVGLAGEEYQQQGLQIGTFSSCEVYGNVLLDGPTNGIFVLGAQDSSIYNNLVVGFAGDGIYMNYGSGGDAAADATYEVYFNTVVDYGRNGIRAHSDLLRAVIAKNNLVIGAEGQIAPGSEVTWEEEGNLLFTTRDEAGFVGIDDFHLAGDSPARGAGVALEIDFDLEGLRRPNPPSVGAYEYPDDAPGGAPGTEGPPPPPTTSTGGSGSAAPPDGNDGSADGGCGCRAGAPTPWAWGWLVVLLGLATRRRSPTRAFERLSEQHEHHTDADDHE
jgi:MYXO-CTERM domain-containing protein